MRVVADRCAGLVSAWCCRYLVGKLKAIPIEAAEEQANKEEVVESLRMMAELIIWATRTTAACSSALTFVSASLHDGSWSLTCPLA